MAKEQTPATSNLYSRLGLDSGATDEEVRSAYYRLAKALHPDRGKGNERGEEAFNSLVRAATILRDPAKRKLYDSGAIDEHGALAGSRSIWPRWSLRDCVLACLIAALTMLMSTVAYYSLNGSGRAFPPGGAQAEGVDRNTAAGPAAEAAPPAQPVKDGKQPAPATRIDDSPAEHGKAGEGQEAANPLLPAVTAAAHADPAPAGIAVAAADRQSQTARTNSIFSRANPANKQKSRIPPRSQVVLSSYPRAISHSRNECSLTSAAREILAGILSH
jgi:curved DNA-binding protein CbpA